MLKNKTAIVTGASGGIGSVIVKKLISEGVNVIAIGRDKDKLEKLNTKFFVCDFSDLKQISDTTSDIAKELSTLDILINVAGVAKYGSIKDLSKDDINEAFAVNIKAPLNLIQDLLPLLEKTKESLVVNIGSGAGKIPMRGRSLYCSTKFALRGLSMSLSEEYEGKTPSFVHIALGSTLTDFGPMTLEEKEKAANNGKAYFPVDYVANQIIEIIKDREKQTPEVELYPSEHGFGEWKKP